MTDRTENLLLEIARCPHVATCLTRDGIDHPCSTIVRSQWAVGIVDHQLPEPWSGRIDSAPILFVSSNPSIRPDDTPSWSDQEITDYFSNRYGGGRKQWTKDGKSSLLKDGSYAEKTSHFRAEVAARAGELLGRKARAGIDYVLTEVVHCKSKAETGVKEARDECVARYLKRVLECAAANVIVVLGSHAAKSVRTHLGILDRTTVHGPFTLGGLERFLLFMPHPSAFGPRKFARHLLKGELERVRSFLDPAYRDMAGRNLREQ